MNNIRDLIRKKGFKDRFLPGKSHIGELSSTRALVKSETAPRAVEVLPTEVREVTPKDVVEAIIAIKEATLRQESEGEVNTYDLSLTDSVKEVEFRHPVTDNVKPLITCQIFQDGASRGQYRVNYPSSSLVTLKQGEEVTLDFTKSKKKISRVFYRTVVGSVSTSRLIGKF